MVACILQGVAASVSRVQGGKMCTPTVKAVSLASILQAVVKSGIDLHVFTLKCGASCSVQS